MSTGEHDLEPTTNASVDEGAEAPEAAEQTNGEEEKPKLKLHVEITESGPCKKHIKVAVSRDDIERQFENSLTELKKEAAIPGFRPGRAPRQLVQRRYRKEMAGQVKSALLLAAMEQLGEDYKLNPISQPELDVEAIELPDEGPMRFEMDIEVQPEFQLPDYKSLTVKRPTRTITDADVDAQVKAFLERYAQEVPKLEGGAEIGDLIVADLTFHKDGVILNQVKEVKFRLQPELRFQDGHVPELAKALEGVLPNEVREADAHIGKSSPDAALRGQTIRVTFNVLDLKRYRLPEVNAEFLRGIGFDSLDELKQALREILERRLGFQQRQAVRTEILGKLVEATPFDLPADLVSRQEKSTLRRQVHELRESGLSEPQIRAREAEIRANAHEETLQSLKEFFILSKIAEAEDIKVNDDDLEDEIEAIAARSDESPRRVRARIEKEGLTEAVASQILERKTIDRILESVTYEEVPLVEEGEVETIDQTAAAAREETAGEGEEGGEPEPSAEPNPAG